MAAPPARLPGAAPRDEARPFLAGPQVSAPRGTRLQQLTPFRLSGKRRRPPEGGDAADGFPDPGGGRCHGRPGRKGARGGSERLFPPDRGKTHRTTGSGADPRRGHGNPRGGNHDRRIRSPHLRRPRREHRTDHRRRIPLLLRRDLPDRRGGIHRFEPRLRRLPLRPRRGGLPELSHGPGDLRDLLERAYPRRRRSPSTPSRRSNASKGASRSR